MASQKEIITLSQEEKEILNQYTIDNDKISCFDAIKVSKLINHKTINMSDICKTLNIKIIDCKLGVFGNTEFEKYNDEIYKKISKRFKDNTDIACASLWKLADEYSLLEVGSTTKNSDIEVINCRLGCFTKRKNNRNHQS
jgi:hypothetical protein